MAKKNVLVAVDMTGEAQDVLKAAAEISTDESTLSIVTVIAPLAEFYINLYSVLGDSPRTEVHSQELHHVTEWLSELVEDYKINPDNVHVVMGTPATEIRRLAKALETDLIVIGTHGRRGLGRMLGSTANAVLHGVPCDVLAVKVHVDQDQSFDD